MPDAASLQRLLDGEHREIRERVREALSRPEFAPVVGLPRDKYRALVLRWARALAKTGDSALGFPSEFGGSGDVGGSVAAFETLAFGDLSLLVKFGVQFGLFGGAVLHLGTRKHHIRYLRRIAALDLAGCFAMTETGHGSDVQSIKTTATYDTETREFVVNTPGDAAAKDYIGNAARDGRMAAVFAQLEVGGEPRGVHALLVPLRRGQGRTRPGVRIEDCGEKLGLNGVDNGRIWFDHVRVPREALLDRYAKVTPNGRYRSPIENPNKRFFTMLGTLIQGRVSVCGAAISGAKSALMIATRYSLRRRQFGPPDGEEVVLLDYRTQQRRLLPAIATTYALHFAQAQLVAQLHEAFTTKDYPDRSRRELEKQAAGLKAVATWHATETIQQCREACGGAGYLAVNRLAALKADTDVFTTFEGDNTVLMQLVGKSLLTDFRDQFGDLDPLGMVRFVAGQALEALAERSGARKVVGRLTDELVPSRDEDTDFLDRTYQRFLFEWRAEHVLASAARRLKRGMDEGGDPFQVFIDCQDHVVQAARANLDLTIFDAFAAAVERTEDSVISGLLGSVCDLFVLANLECDRGWFQEHSRLSSTRSKAIIRAVNRICGELRPRAGLLVDGFGVPDAILAGTIGARETD